MGTCNSKDKNGAPVRKSNMSKKQTNALEARIRSQQARQSEAHQRKKREGLQQASEFTRGVQDVKQADGPLNALAKITHFDVSILRQLEHLFDVISGSQVEDEAIDKDELASALGLHTDSLLVRTIFRLFDVTQASKINFRTWVITLSSLSTHADVDEKIRFSFSLYDLNGDGHIEKDELAGLLQAAVKETLTELCEADVRALCEATLRTVDLDGNGLVDYAEYRAMVSHSPQFLECFTIDVESLLRLLQRHDSLLGCHRHLLQEDTALARGEQFKARKVNRTVVGSDADVFAAAIGLGAPAGVSRVEAQELVWVEGDDEPVVGPWLSDALAPGSLHPFTCDPEDMAAFKEYVPDGMLPGSALASPMGTPIPARVTARTAGGLRVEEDEDEMDLTRFLCATADVDECHVPPVPQSLVPDTLLPAPTPGSPASSVAGSRAGSRSRSCSCYGPAAALAMGFRVDAPQSNGPSRSGSISRPHSRAEDTLSRRGSYLSVPRTPSGPSQSHSRSRRSTPSPNLDPYTSPRRTATAPLQQGRSFQSSHMGGLDLDKLPSPASSPVPSSSDALGSLSRSLVLSKSAGLGPSPGISTRALRSGRTSSMSHSRTPSLHTRGLSPLRSDDFEGDLALELDGPPPMLPMPSFDASAVSGSPRAFEGYLQPPSSPYRDVSGKQYGGFALYDDGHAELIEVVEDLDLLEVDDPNTDGMDMQKSNANAPGLARLLESMRSLDDE